MQKENQLHSPQIEYLSPRQAKRLNAYEKKLPAFRVWKSRMIKKGVNFTPYDYVTWGYDL